jgi:hypothetical protein
VAVPVWPALEWVLFCFTGVTVEAARALAVAVFFVNLGLSYALLRAGRSAGSRFNAADQHPSAGTPVWPALVGVSLLVTSPFLYCFSRLAILEPLLTALVLVALNVAVRLGQRRRPVLGAAAVGALAVLASLTKTTAIFLLPALAVAMAAALWRRRGLVLRCVAAAGGVFAGGYGLWLALVARLHLLADYKYYFFVNDYPRPPEWWWPLQSLWWSTHGVLWADRILAPLAGMVVVGAVVSWVFFPVPKSEGPGAPARTRGAGLASALSQVPESGPGAPSHSAEAITFSPVSKARPGAPIHSRGWARGFLLDPVVGASVLGIAGMILFMTYQNHPQPRYFAPVAFFVIFLLVRGVEALAARAAESDSGGGVFRGLTGVTLAVAATAMIANGARTLEYATHPEYTFVTAVRNLTAYIDAHPNGNRLLVSISGDEITLLTHLPSLCDDFGTMDLPDKIGAYKPGWYASWNDLDEGTLEDLHTHYSVEQVAEFPAFDHPDRNLLVLFKLHPLPQGEVRDEAEQNLKQPMAEDRIEVDVDADE